MAAHSPFLSSQAPPPPASLDPEQSRPGRNDMAYAAHASPLDAHIIIATAALLFLLLSILLLNFAIRWFLRRFCLPIPRLGKPTAPHKGLTKSQVQGLPIFTYTCNTSNEKVAGSIVIGSSNDKPSSKDIGHDEKRIVLTPTLDSIDANIIDACPISIGPTPINGQEHHDDEYTCPVVISFSSEGEEHGDLVAHPSNILIEECDLLHVNSSNPCSICLGDFVDGDSLRMLPSCRHKFHVACVDMWLVKHSSCPACRADLFETLKTPSVEQQILQEHVVLLEDTRKCSL